MLAFPGIAARLCIAFALLSGVSQIVRAQSQVELVLPSTAAVSEENSSMFWFTSPFESRHQLIIEESLLRQYQGMTLVGFDVRRNTGQNRDLSAGRLWVEVDVSTTSTPMQSPSREFSKNHGGNRAPAFARWLTLPATNASPRQPAEWSSPYSLDLRFAVGFLYRQGHLCIETRTRLTGPGKAVAVEPWWPIDAQNASIGGTKRLVGTSCIPDMPGTPADADTYSLTPGATARFLLFGPSSQTRIAMLMLGTRTTTIRLDALGAPACVARVFAGFVLVAPYALYPSGNHGIADARFSIPNQASFVGASLAGQWLVASSSNALGLCLSNSVETRLGPSFSADYAMVSASSADATIGDIRLDRHPVIRLLFKSTP